MPDAIITSTASTFGTITGTFAADQSTVSGTVSGIITGTLTGSVGVPGPQGPVGPQGPQGEPGEGVPAGGLEGQILLKASDTSYDTVWADNSAVTLTATVRNETGATLSKGTVVYINGGAGNKPLVVKASASTESGSSKTFAILAQDIPTNQNGQAVTMGLLKGIDTTGFSAGSNLWLSTTPGAITATPPVSPAHAVFLGNAVRIHANQGEIEVRIQNGYELGELHDVLITTPTNGQVLKYDSATSLWKNGTDVGVPAGGTAGQFLQKIDGTDYNTDWVTVPLSSYLVKANNLSDLTNVATARDNLQLGTLNGPTFASLAIQGSGANLANLGSTFLTLNQVGHGQFTIQPSQGIVFPDASIQTTAFPAGSDMPLGGLTGQALVKQSNSNYDADWQTISSAATWGSIGGTLSSQTDLQTALDGKYSTSNPAGYITSSALSPYLLSSTAASTYQTIAGMSDYLAKAGNLSGLANLATSRSNLGLGISDTATFSEVRAFGTEYKSYVTQFGFTNSRTYSGPSGTVVNYGVLTSDDGISLIKEIGNPAQATATVKAGDGLVVDDGDGSQMTFGSTGITFPDLSVQTTAADLTGYATESWVTSQGYLTSAPVTSVAGKTGAVTLDNADISGLGTLATVNDAPSDGNEYVRKNAAWSVATGGGGGGGVDVQTFGSSSTSGSFTWTKPAGAKWVEIYLFGGGGGGGSGARRLTSSIRGGGGGGGGGGYLFTRVPADVLGSTETVIVGAGGTGGASVSSDSTNGNNGTDGGNTDFSSFRAVGGGAGAAGTNTAGGNFGSGRTGWNLGGGASTGANGGAGSTASGANAGNTSTAATFMSTGGGGGGGAAAASTVQTNGGNGGQKLATSSTTSGLVSAVSGGSRGTSAGVAATAGVSTNGLSGGGTGGGGGFYISSTAGGAGGSGGWPAGAGGGGGASDDGNASGKGGDGANGVAIIITYF
jgi:hypothetical protein